MTSPVLQRLGARVVVELERDELLAEQRLGQQPRPGVAGDLLRRLGLERHPDGRAGAVGAHLADVADEQAAGFDVTALAELVADAAGLQLHHDDGREGLLVQRDAERHHPGQHAEEQQPGELLLDAAASGDQRR
jgi:hypothetical protein